MNTNIFKRIAAIITVLFAVAISTAQEVKLLSVPRSDCTVVGGTGGVEKLKINN